MKRNSSRRIARRSQEPTNSHWKLWLLVVLIASAILALVIISTPDKKTQPTAPAKPQVVIHEVEAVQLINSLFATVNPANPENSYFTPLMREKINWFYTEIALKKLEFRPYPQFQPNPDGTFNQAVFMDSGYESKNKDGKPPYIAFVQFYVARLFTYIRLQQKVPTGFNQMTKNTFALLLIHEAVHFEQPPARFLTNLSDEERKEEENRAWFKVNMGAVRQLRQLGQPLDLDFIRCDDALKRCNDNRHCPDFQEFIEGAGNLGGAYYRKFR